MDQDKQTLLEAAKAMSRACDGTSRWDVEVNRFRAAIAREEAHPSPTTEANDRAQQAEAEAAWHKAESARLSAELAKERERAEKAEAERDLAKNQLALSVERLERQSVMVQSVTQASGCHMLADVSDSIRSLRARAEKAEAEVARLSREEAKNRDRFAKLMWRDDHPTISELARGEAGRQGLWHLARAGIPMPASIAKSIPGVVDELLRLRAELARTHDDAATPPHSPPFEGDPKACVFKPSSADRIQQLEADLRWWKNHAQELSARVAELQAWRGA